jgi:subtilisin family serine protease
MEQMPAPHLLAGGLLQACLAMGADAPADAAPVWVFFAEDRAMPASIGDTALSPRAVSRRALRRTLPGLFDRHDVPVCAEHADAVAGTGARVRITSRWLNAVSAVATPAQRAALAALPAVTHVEPVGRGRAGWQDEREGPPPEGWTAATDYGASIDQLRQIDLPRLHAWGKTGAGMVIGVLDTGFNRVHEAFNQPGHPLQVIAEWDFINNDGNTGMQAGDDPNQHKHGTWILGTMGAYMPGTLVGGAFDAQFVLAKTENVPTETPIEEDWYVAGLEFVESHGADVATSSLGYIDWYTQADLNGTTAVTTVGVNIATANGMVCVTAAGNDGHDADPATSTIIAPADAFNVITCGAADLGGNMAGFSSSGPTADGRLKPEVTACGVSTVTVNSTNATGLAGVSGTSLSTPLVAAAAACILQARPEYGVAGLREALFATASRSDGAGLHPDPMFVEGHGLVRAFDAALRGRSIADLNLDGAVSGADLGIVLGRWGITGEPGLVFGDLNGDGTINGVDLGFVLGNWG